MAQYSYDESGGMASFLVLTFLAMVLIPLTYSYVPARGASKYTSCDCSECTEKAKSLRKREGRSLLSLRVGSKALITVVLWLCFAVVLYSVSTTTIESSLYDPFTILGIRPGTSEKDIKRHYKKLSLKFHPDKVKLAINQTMEMVESQFVELTKAYKSLTDETVRRNLELYGHPDGKQEYSVGIAIPRWIIEGHNNIWVLGLYGIVFGAGLPFLVGRWWFSSRRYTKDRVQASTAALFFKNARDRMEYAAILELIGHSWSWEGPKHQRTPKEEEEQDELVRSVRERVPDWKPKAEFDIPATRRATALLWAHLLRVPISNPAVKREQADLLLQAPPLLASMLSIALAHNWLALSLSLMRLHAALVQAVVPNSPAAQLEQLPGMTEKEAEAAKEDDMQLVLRQWQKLSDPRLDEAKKAVSTWGKLEVVDAYFKVIDEKVVTPQSIVFLVMKLRLHPPTLAGSEKIANGHATMAENGEPSKSANDEETAFLLARKEAEDLPTEAMNLSYAHAPRWPDNRKPSWWVFIGDRRTERVVVPPIRISNIPLYDESRSPHNYRTYKMQFQAPPQVAVYPFTVHFVSDTFVGEDVTRDLKLQVVDAAVLGAEVEEDDISDPEEDTLEGQLAVMKGGAVKRSPVHAQEDDDESETDDDVDSDSDSDSD